MCQKNYCSLKNRFLRLLPLLALVTTSDAAVSAGSIAITGFTSDYDDFTWVALRDIAEGEVLYFADTSYKAGGFFNINEGIVQFVAPTGGVSAGTFTHVRTASLGSGYTELMSSNTYSDGSGLSISGSGDQLVVFQDDDLSDATNFSPIFAASSADITWDDYNSNGTTSLIYPGLTDGVNAVTLGEANDVEHDYIYYTGPSTGSAETLLGEIADNTNWTGGSNSLSDVNFLINNTPTSFTVIPEPSTSSLLGLAGAVLIFRRKK